LKVFRINLKAFLGLVLPNQHCHIVMQGILAGFNVNFLHGAPPQSSTSLLWITIVVHDKHSYNSTYYLATIKQNKVSGYTWLYWQIVLLRIAVTWARWLCMPSFMMQANLSCPCCYNHTQRQLLCLIELYNCTVGIFVFAILYHASVLFYQTTINPTCLLIFIVSHYIAMSKLIYCVYLMSSSKINHPLHCWV